MSTTINVQGGCFKTDHYANPRGKVTGNGKSYLVLNIRTEQDKVHLYPETVQEIRDMAAAFMSAALVLEHMLADDAKADAEKAKLVDDVLANREVNLPGAPESGACVNCPKCEGSGDVEREGHVGVCPSCDGSGNAEPSTTDARDAGKADRS